MFPKTYSLNKSIKCIIRRAEVNDAEKLLQCIRTVAGETAYLPFSPNEFNLSVEDLSKRIEESINDKKQLRLVVDIEGDIIGELTFRTGKWKQTEHVGEFGIMLRKDYRGMGIGTLLLESLISWAKKSHVRKINLKVRTDNKAAIHLYKKFGFQIEGTLSREFFINGQFYDCYIMGLQLD